MATPNSSGKPETVGMIRARELIAREHITQTSFLDLGNLSLTELPVELLSLTHLRHLNLGWFYRDFSLEYHSSKNNLEDNIFFELPNTIIALKELTHISLCNCGIANLHNIAKLRKIQYIDVSLTSVSSLEPLKNISELLSLDCFGTEVTSLEPLKHLSNLQSLYCSSTDVPSLEPLKNLNNLKILSFASTPISCLEPIIHLTSLKTLAFSDTFISDLEPLKKLSNLQSLDCSNTQVFNLESLEKLSSLQTLDCSNTQVVSLKPLKQLSNLQSLNCADTDVSSLEPLSKLTSLQSLNCIATKITKLDPLEKLANLQSFKCAGTKVFSLEPLKKLTELQSLDCTNTKVTDLRPLTKLESIQFISASKCPITELPVGLVFKQSLSSLFLHQITISGIPPEVLSDKYDDNCLDRLQAHLKDLEAGSETMSISKLVVVGNGRVGKTQICRLLQKLEYDEKVPTTHGIVIANFPWPDADKDECLNLWDFGGQDIYHGTHALFLKTRASYLLVWNPEFEDGAGLEAGGVSFQNQPLAYWLEYIRTLGRDNRPIIIVQSCCDRPELEARRLPVDESYLTMPFLKICHVSAKKNRGQAALREAITDAIHYLHDKEGISLIGTGRMKVIRKLEAWRKTDQKLPRDERQHRTLSLTEFEILCEDAGGISSQNSLLEYLHNIGTVFYQPDLFAGKIILDQTWALEAVYSVFDRDKSCRQIMGLSGHFTRSLLEMAVWSEYSEAEQKLFISLMESCGICFLHRNADARLGLETEYLAPDLLPDKARVMYQLNGRWDDTAPSQSLVYEYPFLHPGLMRSLICDAGKRAGDAGVYWKYGVWVYEKGTGSRALMEQEMTDTQRGRIVARVQGERSGELAQWLRKRIADRSRLFGYPEIKPTLDEFPKEETLQTQKPAVEAKPVEAKILPAETVPKFDRLPVEQFPKRARANFVSYAWSDSTPEGEKRRKLVDDLCSAMEKQGTKILRDCEQMKTGDRISEFMDRLVEGDHIICVISDKYLRSPNCMHELFHIYRRCGDNGDHFLKKVIPLIMPDAKLKTVSERLAYAGYWKQEQINLEKLIKEYGTDVVGNEAYRKYKNICEFSKNVSDILELLNDRLMPRDFDRMAREGFREVLQLTQ